MTDPVRDRHAIRLKLLENGYEPLPLAGKACFIPTWSFRAIDVEFLEAYRRAARFSNTGIRTGHVVGVDIDAPRADIAELLDRLAEETLGPTPFCRFGNGEKRLLLYWTDTPTPKRRSGLYEGQRLEILGRGNQFAAYGIHPTTEAPYAWDDAQPLTHSVDDLPAVTPAQLDYLVSRADEALGARLKWERAGGASAGDSTHDYCLTDEMTFEITKPVLGLMSVAAIKEALPKGQSWECNLTAIRADSDSRAGRAHWGASGLLSITDFVTDTTYFEVQTLKEESEAVADLLPEAPAPGASMFKEPADLLADLVRDWVYVSGDGTVRHVHAPTRAQPFASWDRRHTDRVPSQKTGKAVTLGKAWLEQCQCADYVALLPSSRERVVADGRLRVLNSYVPPAHDARGGDAAVFYEFMAHLVPLGWECEVFLDWLALKCQHPDWRMHAVVMVANRTYGTGRGTLMQVIESLLGPEYCTETSFAHVAGSTTQSQYNDYLASSLMVYVPEALDSAGHESRWHARRDGYEHVKNIVETSAKRTLIKRKGVANTPETVYASLLVSTNHRDAFAIEAGDRRLIVLQNGARLEDGANDLLGRVIAWSRRPANIAALYHDLLARRTQYNPWVAPPNTAAKQLMVVSSDSDIDVAYNYMLDKAPGDVVTSAQWRRYVAEAVHELALTLPDVRQLDRLLEGVLGSRASRVKQDNPRWLMRIGSARVRPWIIRNERQWQDECPDTDKLAAEIAKNGDPGGQLIEFPR